MSTTTTLSRKHGDRAKATGTAGEPVTHTRKTIKGREIIDYIIEKHRAVIVAPDRAGKTALSRTLFKDLWKNGTNR